MARELLALNFTDGSVFHAYHAYECVLSALIASEGLPVPPEGATQITLPHGKTVKGFLSPSGTGHELSTHKARILFFNDLADKTKPYFKTHNILSRFVTVQARNDALYYDTLHDRLPHQAYNELFASQMLSDIRQFANEVWQEIK